VEGMENGLPAERFLYPKLTNDGDLTKHSRRRYAVVELYSTGLPRPSLHFISAAATVKS